MSDQDDPIVGHKTFWDAPTGFRHEPIRKSEAEVILAAIDAADARRKEIMPNEWSAINMMFDAHIRLKDFGWKDAIYCPKDGSIFNVLEAGSTGIHVAHYQGEWPAGHWYIHDPEGDLSPSHPILYKENTK